MSAYSLFVNVLGILTTPLYNNTATQLQPHSYSHTATATSRDSMQAGTESRCSIAVLDDVSANHPIFI